ncbi:hypothetical protein SKAU_G00321310 [Synaphobranchus kaupii]|uniref:DDE Tnp4 domain-containing protein n=1 Tax=Synaphobranchus kaupii TaxID=118154 RepID=A0A9Q1ENQ6_SYNKA|nr:hypothetical protein SKAU_G00321310 [Synaphobranchus kaupii]
MEHILRDRRKVVALLLLARRIRRRKRLWVRPQHRAGRCHFHNLVAELRLDGERHRTHFRMRADQMDHLLSLIGPDLTKATTNYRKPIDPKQRMAVALRYLGSGESLCSLALAYRMGNSTVSSCIELTCEAVSRRLGEMCVPPLSEADWRGISQRFHQERGFPSCLGAVAGKRFSGQVPQVCRANLQEYTVTALALVDTDLRFRALQIGAQLEGYAASALGRGMEDGTLHVPEDALLPGAPHLGKLPFVMVADTAFPLKVHLMRPYPEPCSEQRQLFNARLARARGVADDAFAVLAARWPALYRRINLLPRKVEALVRAACLLHNMLLDPAESHALLREAAADDRRPLQAVRSMGSKNATRRAYYIRDKFCRYVSSPEGGAPGQDEEP